MTPTSDSSDVDPPDSSQQAEGNERREVVSSIDEELADDLAIPPTTPDYEQQDWYTARLSNLDAAARGLEDEQDPPRTP